MTMWVKGPNGLKEMQGISDDEIYNIQEDQYLINMAENQRKKDREEENNDYRTP